MPPDKVLRVHSYHATGNIGDAIQTIALARLLGAVQYVPRHTGTSDATVPFVVNGWLGGNRPSVENSNCLFAGVHINDNEGNYRWMGASRYSEIGARDPATVIECGDRGLRALLIGCATMTFSRYEGPRSRTYVVDADYPKGNKVTHFIGDCSWDEQLAHATSLLRGYESAELVVTSRLHVALPCLAFGTPVLVRDPVKCGDRSGIRRFSILDAIGVPYDRVCEMDISRWSKRYCDFLERNLQISIRPQNGVPEWASEPPPAHLQVSGQ